MKIRDVADDQLWWDSRSGEDRARTQALKDQLPDYTTRDLSTVARRVMVLNEIAASRGRGYFLHLPANAALTSFPSTARLPEERRIQHVNAFCLDLAFTDFVWDAESRSRYRRDTQRARLLRSSAVMNPPTPDTPVFPVQFVATVNDAPTVTAGPSLVLIDTPTTYYLVPTSELRQIVGRSKRSKDKMSMPRHFWDASQQSTGKPDAQRQKQEQMRRMQPFARASIEDVYREFIRQCSGFRRTIQASLTGVSLRAMVPRPDKAQAASVGIGLGGGRSAEPPSRRLQKRKRKRQEGDSGGGEDGDDDDGYNEDGDEDREM